MKKIFFVFILTLLLIGGIFAGCSASNNSETTPTATPVATEPQEEIEEIDFSKFPEFDTSTRKDALEVYRKEVKSRLENLEENASFFTEAEWEAISTSYEWQAEEVYKNQNSITTFDKLYESVSEYFFPVVFRDGNSLVLCYTYEDGTVLLRRLHGYWNNSNYVGELHYDSDSYEESVISSDFTETVTYNQETGKVTVWNFQEEINSYTLPKGAVYCGLSFFEGYIFRSGTDVYALRRAAETPVVCIAHNVQYVIDASYSFGSDPWSQPLLQMTDGSLKVYLGWGEASDSPDCLQELRYEGGFKK